MNGLRDAFTVHSNPLNSLNHLRAMHRTIQLRLHFVWVGDYAASA
jgi:hypothetical protein